MPLNETKTFVVCSVLSLTLRVLLSNSSYSGQSKPLMYGDYEAQRHWMEITSNLPIGEWYYDTTNNDLRYWGLDYPPLTAYVSWGCGKISELVEPASMTLFTSRGYETDSHKMFMRVTVLVLDLLVYFPAVWSVLGHLYPNHRKRCWAYLLALAQPALLLIDHGHFQYNSVCLGLSLWAVSAILSGYDVIGSVLFCLALNFKQIALYYAPAFFFVLLGNCFRKVGPGRNWLLGLWHLVKLGGAVIGTFAIHWLPFCLWPYPGTTCFESLGQVLHRLFPFARGVFEDKVANLWYFLSVTMRIRDRFERSSLVLLSLAVTLLFLTPTCYLMIRKKVTSRWFLLGLTGSSLAFFLAAFQVHEKSLLFPLTPLSLLAVEFPVEVAWFSTVGCFSMYPLLQKDGLQLPYIACLCLYTTMTLGFMTASKSPESSTNTSVKLTRKVLRLGIAVTLSAMFCMHLCEVCLDPPVRYPDLYPSLFSLLSFLIFIGVFTFGAVLCFSHIFHQSPQSDKNQVHSIGSKIIMNFLHFFLAESKSYSFDHQSEKKE